MEEKEERGINGKGLRHGFWGMDAPATRLPVCLPVLLCHSCFSGSGRPVQWSIRFIRGLDAFSIRHGDWMVGISCAVIWREGADRSDSSDPMLNELDGKSSGSWIGAGLCDIWGSKTLPDGNAAGLFALMFCQSLWRLGDCFCCSPGAFIPKSHVATFPLPASPCPSLLIPFLPPSLPIFSSVPPIPLEVGPLKSI